MAGFALSEQEESFRSAAPFVLHDFVPDAGPPHRTGRLKRGAQQLVCYNLPNSASLPAHFFYFCPLDAAFPRGMRS
jgi:hypothetical protein